MFTSTLPLVKGARGMFHRTCHHSKRIQANGASPSPPPSFRALNSPHSARKDISLSSKGFVRPSQGGFKLIRGTSTCCLNSQHCKCTTLQSRLSSIRGIIFKHFGIFFQERISLSRNASALP